MAENKCSKKLRKRDAAGNAARTARNKTRRKAREANWQAACAAARATGRARPVLRVGVDGSWEVRGRNTQRTIREMRRGAKTA